MSRLTIAELKNMQESEDHVEFKKGEHGNVSYNGDDKQQPKDRRCCIPGYVIALCNEKVEKYDDSERADKRADKLNKQRETKITLPHITEKN